MENEYKTERIQSTAVKIKTTKYNLIVAAAYCPLGRNPKQDYQEFLDTLGERFILGGDYNAKNIQLKKQ